MKHLTKQIHYVNSVIKNILSYQENRPVLRISMQKLLYQY